MLSKKKYLQIVQPKLQPWERFYRNTHNQHNIDLSINKPIPPEWTTISYKAYARMPIITLPQPSKLTTQTLKSTLKKRTSVRNTKKPKSLSLEDVSTLLYYSLGINKDSHRFYPSAGARYPVEAYVLVNNVNTLEKGIYHYYVRTHSLERLFPLPNSDLQNMFIHDFPPQSSCMVILTGFFKRSMVKYKNRGYNYTFIEAGHIGQNISLLSSALDLDCCAIGGFVEKEVNNLLDLNSDKESAIYLFSIN